MAIVEQILSFLNPLLRSDDQTRHFVLAWLGVALDGAGPRATMGFQQQMYPPGANLCEHLEKSAQFGGSLEKFRRLSQAMQIRFN